MRSGFVRAGGGAGIERERLADQRLRALRQAGEAGRRAFSDLDGEARDFIMGETGGGFRRMDVGVGQVGFDVINRRAVDQVQPA